MGDDKRRHQTHWVHCEFCFSPEVGQSCRRGSEAVDLMIRSTTMFSGNVAAGPGEHCVKSYEHQH